MRTIDFRTVLTHAIVHGVVCMIGVGRECTAQEVGNQKWFDRVWEEASRWKPESPLHIRVAYERHYNVDLKVVEELRRRVGNAKSGADRQRLNSLEQQLARPIGTWVEDVCTDGKRLRFGSTSPTSEMGLQFALGEVDDWFVLPDGTMRIAPGDMTEPEYGVRGYQAAGDSLVRLVVWAGLGAGPGSDLKPMTSQLNGQEWTGTVSRGGGTSAISVIRGRVAPQSLPAIAGMTIQSTMLADESLRIATPLGHAKYSKWSSNEVLHRPVVSEVTWVDSDGRMTQRMTLQVMEIVSEAAFRELLKVPTDGGVDGWGRRLKLTAIQDVRASHLKQVVLRNGEETEIPLQVPVIAASGPRWAKYGIPIGLAATAVLIAWKCRRLGRADSGGNLT